MSEALALVVLVPMVGGALCCLLARRWQLAGGALAAAATCASVISLAVLLSDQGVARQAVGGWLAPLGITLQADGLSLLMLALTALVGGGVSVYAGVYFAAAKEGHATVGLFWPLWLLLWGALNALFVSADIFNLYLLLEFSLVAAVALAALGGSRAGHVSALRYLLAATAAGLFYLMGVALLYADTGTLDLRDLAAIGPRGFRPTLALSLMLSALCLKCALFPLHFWLPPAHSTAPAPVSAVLSALVVKAAFYIILRLWFEALPGVAPPGAALVLATLGAIAIVWGSWQALRQHRLKMLVAYSTVAQVGYLFLLLPLAAVAAAEVRLAVTYHMLSHGLAKAGMFLGAGAVLKAAHSDHLDHTRGLARRAPLAVAAIIVSGCALSGLLPGGGAKGKFLHVLLEHGQGWWAVVVGVGMLLALAYTWVAVRRTFLPGDANQPVGWIPRALGALALVLALASVGFSFISERLLSVLEGKAL